MLGFEIPRSIRRCRPSGDDSLSTRSPKNDMPNKKYDKKMNRTLFVALVFLTTACTKNIDTWITINPEPIRYAAEAIWGEIPIPGTKYSGKIKFLKEAGTQVYQLGYLVEIEIEPLDPEKIPKKYKEERKTIIEGRPMTLLPTDSAYYSAELEFTLKDKDGFELKKVKSNPFQLESGSKSLHKTNKIQNVTESIGIDIIERVTSVESNLTILKCTTCN